MLERYRKLRASGVMGLNERNLRLVNDLNPRRLMKLVNDKLETKILCTAAGIPTPGLCGTVQSSFDMRRLPQMLKHPTGVAIKPANGSQGNGILVIAEPMKDAWKLANGRRVVFEDLKFHVSNIISGMYSLGGLPDKAMIEERVIFSKVFDHITFKGVPDIRIIVLKGIPMFAMLRLATAESDGKANLHKGGVGVGLDLVTGVTALGMQHGKYVEFHPDTANTLQYVEIPHWDEMLLMAARAYDVTQLGYLGVDIVLDQERGPLLLEMNARPGIAIQVANRSGLRFHVDALMKEKTAGMTPEQRVVVAKRVFRELIPEPQRPIQADATETSSQS